MIVIELDEDSVVIRSADGKGKITVSAAKDDMALDEYNRHGLVISGVNNSVPDMGEGKEGNFVYHSGYDEDVLVVN